MRGRFLYLTHTWRRGSTRWSCGPLVLLIAILGAARVSGQQSVILRMAPPVGQVSHYRYEMQMWVPIPWLPAVDTAAASMRSTCTLTQTVTRADGELRDLRVSYDSVRFEAPMFEGTLLPMAQLVGQSLRGLVVTTRMDSRGRVLAMEVIGGDAAAKRQIPRMTSGQQVPVPVLPESSVTVGTTWSDSQNVTLPTGAGQARTGVTYRLERLDPQLGGLYAVIRGTGTFMTDGAGTPRSASGAVVSEVVLDLTAGRLVRATSTTNVTTEVPQTGQPVRIRMVASAVLMTQPTRRH